MGRLRKSIIKGVLIMFCVAALQFSLGGMSMPRPADIAEQRFDAPPRPLGAGDAWERYYTMDAPRDPPCGAARAIPAGLCAAPAVACAASLRLGRDTYGVGLGLTASGADIPGGSGAAFWTTLRDGNGAKVVHVNTLDPARDGASARVQRDAIDDDEYEVFRRALLRVPEHERGGRLVVDVGARFGFYSLSALSYGFAVKAFEPRKAHLARLLSSLDRNGDGFAARFEGAYNVAASNGAGTLALTGSQGGLYGVDFATAAPLDDVVDEDVYLLRIGATSAALVLDGARRLLCERVVANVVVAGSERGDASCPPGGAAAWLGALGYEAYEDTRPRYEGATADVAWYRLRDATRPPGARLGGGCSWSRAASSRLSR